jgi:hypothetical protein
MIGLLRERFVLRGLAAKPSNAAFTPRMTPHFMKGTTYFYDIDA